MTDHDAGPVRPKSPSRRAAAGWLLSAGALLAARGRPASAADAKSAPPAAPRFDPKKVARGYARGPFGLVHYQDTGAGRPLVLCHQAPMSSRQFESVYGPLAARGVRAIGIDTPGFGMSDPTDFTPTIEDWAKVVPAVLDHLGLAKAAILGHHTGALMATEATLQFPARFDKLVLHGALPITEPERLARLEQVEKSEKNATLDPEGGHLCETFKRRKAMYGPGADDAVITRYVVERFVGYGPSWHGHFAAYTYKHGDALKRVTHPTLVMSNTGDMIHERTMRLKTQRPDFKFHEFEGGGVDFVDQEPEAWARAVADFVLA